MRIHDQLNETKQNITETAKSKVGRIFLVGLIEDFDVCSLYIWVDRTRLLEKNDVSEIWKQQKTQ